MIFFNKTNYKVSGKLLYIRICQKNSINKTYQLYLMDIFWLPNYRFRS